MSAHAEHGGADGANHAGDFDLRVLLGGDGREREPRWAKVVDQTRCIGCHACTTACRSENEVPLSVTRMRHPSFLGLRLDNPARRSSAKSPRGHRDTLQLMGSWT